MYTRIPLLHVQYKITHYKGCNEKYKKSNLLLMKMFCHRNDRVVMVVTSSAGLC